jgi:hypothetical protein
LQQGIATALSQLVLDGVGDEPAPVPFELVDSLQEIDGQGDGHSLHGWHIQSMP